MSYFFCGSTINITIITPIIRRGSKQKPKKNDSGPTRTAAIAAIIRIPMSHTLKILPKVLVDEPINGEISCRLLKSIHIFLALNI